MVLGPGFRGETMPFTIRYHPDVKKVDLPKIDSKNRKIIKSAIEERLATRPEIFGKPLQRTFKGYWRLRVGDYRIVFKALGNRILILGIIHRKEVYRAIQKRIKP
jgi:mRNA interferase RelE/StbE